MRLPLRPAAQYNTSEAVVKAVLAAHPEAIKEKNNLEKLPRHIANKQIEAPPSGPRRRRASSVSSLSSTTTPRVRKWQRQRQRRSRREEGVSVGFRSGFRALPRRTRVVLGSRSRLRADHGPAPRRGIRLL